MRLSRLGVAGAAVMCAAAGVLVSGVLAAPSGVQATPVKPAKPVVVNVTAGAPSELAFKIVPSATITAGAVTFKVKNAGSLPHDFKVCKVAVSSTTKNACVGTGTALISPGKTATLTLTLKKGVYEFLCTVPGHAIAGMKGLVGIGVKAGGGGTGGTTTTGTTTTKPTTTTKTTTTTKGGTTPTFPTGSASSGQPLFVANCGTCHHLTAAGNTPGAIVLDHTALSVAEVEHQIYNGTEGMPSFAGTLQLQQIADIATFVAANNS